MMAEPGVSLDDARKDRVTLLAMTAGGLILGAILGAIFLTLLYGFLSGFFDWPAKPPYLRWYCALAGGAIGGVRALIRVRQQIQRRRATRGVAENLGMEYSADISEELQDELVSLFGDDGSISITNAVHRNIDSARFVVADMRHRKSSNSNSNSTVTHQTIAYFSSDQLQFPGFELQPEGMLLNLMTSILGVEDIDFSDYPEFSDRYHLAGANPERIRQLFDADLLRHFTGNAGWQIKAAGNQLVMFRPRERFAPADLEGFINDALKTFSLFMASSYALQDATAAAPAGGSRRADAAEAPPPDDVPPMPGLLHALRQSMMVSEDELERFLAAPAPRQIPPEILRQRIGGGSLIAAVMGCIFLAVGLILAAVAFFGMEGPMNEDRIVAMCLGTVFPLVGSTMAFFAIRYRRHNHRLLRHGIVAEGRIEAVERTDMSVNNQRQYRLKVRFSDGLGSRTSTCNIYGKVAQDAQRLHKQDLPVRVLYDRQAPQRILWADAFGLAKF